MDVPEALRALNDQLHELGDEAAPIADAIWVARQLQPMPITQALRGDIESRVVSDEVEKQFRDGLASLLHYLMEAEENVSKLTGLTAANPDTFAGPHAL